MQTVSMNVPRNPPEGFPQMNFLPHPPFYSQNQIQQMQYNSSFNPGNSTMTPQQSMPANPMQAMQPLSMMPPMCSQTSASMNATALNSSLSQQLSAVPPNQTIRPPVQNGPQNPQYTAMQLRPPDQQSNALSYPNSNSFAGPQQQISAANDALALSHLPPNNMLEQASMNELEGGELDGHNVRFFLFVLHFIRMTIMFTVTFLYRLFLFSARSLYEQLNALAQ